MKLANLLPDPAEHDLHVAGYGDTVAVEVILPHHLRRWSEAMAIFYGCDASEVLLTAYRVGLYVSAKYPRASDPETPLAQAVLNDDRLMIRAANLHNILAGLHARLRALVIQHSFSCPAPPDQATLPVLSVELNLPGHCDESINELPVPEICRIPAMPCDLLRKLERFAVIRSIDVDVLMNQMGLCALWLDCNFPSRGEATVARELLAKVGACDRLGHSISKTLSSLETLTADIPGVVAGIAARLNTPYEQA